MSNSRVRCTGCRQYILRDDVFLDAGIGRFCSSDCLSEHQTLRTRKRQDKKRQSRRRSAKKTRHIPMPVRDAVRERDGCCRWCGGRGAHVHHVIYRSEGGPDEERNLVFLCAGCHEMVHSSKAVYQELLLIYLWAFYAEARQLSGPVIASGLRRAGLLSDQQEERLFGEIATTS